MASTYIGALGIEVSDLERSTDFYTRVIGMKKLQTLSLPAIAIAKDPDGYLVELIQKPLK